MGLNSNVATFALTGWTEDRLDGSCSEWICLIFFIHLYTQFFDMHNAAPTNFEFTYSTEHLIVPLQIYNHLARRGSCGQSFPRTVLSPFYLSSFGWDTSHKGILKKDRNTDITGVREAWWKYSTLKIWKNFILISLLYGEVCTLFQRWMERSSEQN